MDFPYDKYIALSLRSNGGFKPSAVVAMGKTWAWPCDAQDAVIKAFDAGLPLPVVSCPVPLFVDCTGCKRTDCDNCSKTR